jgi:hypothetical protein
VTCLLGTEADAVSAVVQNLSARGLAVVVGKWFEASEVVPVKLFNQELTVCLAAQLRVTRRCTLPGGEYFIAGELDRELEPAELQPFLL